MDPLSRRRFWELVQGIRASRPGMSVLATGSPAELLARSGQTSLEAAFIDLLPQERRANHAVYGIGLYLAAAAF